MGIFSGKKSLKQNVSETNKVKSIRNDTEFRHVMDFYYLSLERTESLAERNALREYLLFLLKKEWEFSSITDALYYPKQAYNNHQISIPLESEPESQKQWRCRHFSQGKKVSLANDAVITFPREWKRCTHTALVLGKEPFLQDTQNHSGVYFHYMDFCYITNGYHSTAAGIAFQKGEIAVEEIDDSPILENVYTDGTYWYDETTKTVVGEVGDYHEALIFQLAKENFLENQNDGTC